MVYLSNKRGTLTADFEIDQRHLAKRPEPANKELVTFI